MSVKAIVAATGLGLGFIGAALLLDGVPRISGAGQALAGGAGQVAELAGIEIDGPPAIDIDDLVRIGDRDYRIRFDETLSHETYATAHVRKIGYGRESVVDIAYTPTGTYSTDGFASPHVRYPGVTVEAVPRQPVLLSASFVFLAPPGAGTVVHVAPPAGMTANRAERCVLEAEVRVCR